jgi:DNA-binding transcriptional LysR family regulator
MPVPGDPTMESLYLKTFVEVVRSGSLSRAAERLHVTQPAVSRRIKFMEDQYGRALLDRSGNALRPTDAGRLVYEKARSLLEIEANLVSGLHRLDGKVRISLGCTPSFGIAHLPAVLHEFMLACGDSADLKFLFGTPEQIFAGLKEAHFDVAVMEMCERFDLSSFNTFALPGDEMVFASAPAMGFPRRLDSLAPLLETPLYTRREGCCSRMMLERNLTCVGHALDEFKRVIVFDDLHVIVKAALAGKGIVFLSRDVLGEFLEAGSLQAHYVQGFTHERERAVVVSPSVVLTRPFRQFIDTLFARFRLAFPDALPLSVPPTDVTSAPPAPEMAPARAAGTRRRTR